MNQEKINRDLAENDSTSSLFQQKVVEACRKWAKQSCDVMQQFHATWDSNAYIYRGYRVPDKEDADAEKDKLPPKIIVPITFAQTQTMLSYMLSTFSQKQYVYELKGFSPEDVKNALALTEDLGYQSQKAKLLYRLYNWMLDSAKCGFGVVRCDWKEEYSRMRVMREEPIGGFMGFFDNLRGQAPQTRKVEDVEEVLSYQGNEIRNISPYAFYSDPAVSMANFQEGQFVMHEEEVSIATLRNVENEIYFGIDKIPNEMSKDLFSERYRRVQGPFDNQTSRDKADLLGKNKVQKSVIKSEFEVVLSEKQASEMFKAKLGTDTRPIRWMITIANDQKVIRFEPSGYFHGKFCYSLIEFSPDHDAFYNPGLTDTIQELQNVTTFFLNSHIANVRKVIANRFVVDPNRVELEDIKSGSMFIRTKGVTGVDVQRVVQQLQMADITRSHVADMDTLIKLVQLVTGINDNALGQYASGRRSATEARSVNAGAAARLRMCANLAWMQGIEPLGVQMIANTRQWRTKEIYNQIVGDKALEAPYESVILADPNRIAGGYDFVPYDATLPSDRQYQATMLQGLFEILVSNPDSMQLLNKDPMKLLHHIAELYGITNIRDFELSKMPQPPVASVVPNEQAGEAAAAGAQPVDVAGTDLLAELAR